jgi:hypothetical protein
MPIEKLKINPNRPTLKLKTMLTPKMKRNKNEKQ